MTTRRKRAPQPAALITKIVDVLLPVDTIPDFEEALAEHRHLDGLFMALQKSVARHERYQLPDEVPIYERIQAALPANMQKELVRFSDLKDIQEIVTRDAAYRVGVAVGKRLAGGGR